MEFEKDGMIVVKKDTWDFNKMGLHMNNNKIKSRLSDGKCYYFDAETTDRFLGFLKDEATLIAPRKKGDASYSYEVVEDTGDVVFDYPRTIQPLKKSFFPPKETLLTFNIKSNQYTAEEIREEKKIFFGVHSYEMQGVRRLDYSFTKGQPESNYLKRRENSLFIGISYTPDEWHLAGPLGIDIEETDGFCLYFEPAEEGFFVFEIDQDGRQLLKKFGKGKQVEELPEKQQKEFKAKIKYHYNRLPQVFEHVYNSKVWDEVAERCLGCGTCNLLCPTCYCFDVRDEIELNAEDGARERMWDGCMLNAFAEVAGGENFREKLSSRTRHRLHRKFKYITATSGELHCVGCGRCSRYCPAEINITDIINDLIDDYSEKQQKQFI
jgi:sulfhydrogenase subunit beta (sulfur reductase)